MQPYPGDDEFLHSGVRQHFEVFTRPHACFYQIYDRLTCKGCSIWTGYLKNPHFCLGEWYACWQAHKYDLIEKPKRPWMMGDVYAYNTMCVLQSCIPTLYPSSDLEIDDEFCFTVVSKSEDQYFIHDEDFKEPLTVDKSFLLNPHVDLGNWYHAKCFPKSVETPDDDLNIDFSIFDRVWVLSIFENDIFVNESEDLPVPHPGSGSDDETPGLQSGETDSEGGDNDDLPGLQSVSDSSKEL